ncbi:hypothetical protein AB28_3676 [Raoultella ornithinolytica 2-156-04_S1_C2]|nr:hypothetical protein AB28_3676 [Raoultella ornithinolytica 2-156-04_S1_C2]
MKKDLDWSFNTKFLCRAKEVKLIIIYKGYSNSYKRLVLKFYDIYV